MSHRMQTHDTQQVVSRTRDATVPRAVRSPRARQDARQLETARPSTKQISPPQSSPFMTESSGTSSGKPRSRPTGIPRVPAKAVNVRPGALLRDVSAPRELNSSGESANTIMQEVPLVMDSGEGLNMQYDRSATRRNFSRSDTSSTGRDAQSPLDAAPDAIFGVVMPRISTTNRPTDLPPRLIPELQALAATSSNRPGAFKKSLSSTSSPSTRLSSSPSPWSVSTTTTTPTSWSSASPGAVQPLPAKESGKRSQTVPIPTTTRERHPKIPAVPEAFSRARKSEWPPGLKESRSSPGAKRTPLTTPAPTPPPRTSSTKQALSRSSSRNSKQRGRLEPSDPLSEMERSPLSKRTKDLGESLLQAPLTRAHEDLQQSLGGAPPQPSRRGVNTTGSTMPVVRRGHHPASRSQQTMPTDSAEESRIKQVVVMNREEGYDPHPGTKSQTPPPRSGKFSRLGIFGRRGKSPAPEPEVTPRKLQRKGPTAGTGHEGYGRYGRRGREMSQESRSASNSESERSISSTRRIALFSSKSSKSRSSSRQTRSSQSDLDDFAATRLRPVPIVGGSRAINSAGPGDGLDVYDNAPPSSSGSDKRRPLSQSQGSFGQNSGQDGLGGTGDPALSHRTVPTLAFRRSQRLGNDEEKFSLPMSIRTHELLTPLYISSQEESRSSALLGSLSTPSTTTDLYRSDNSFYKSKDKRNWKRKWNIFRRKGSEQEPEQTAHLPSSSPDELPVSILAISTPRPMPYYAMIDSESEMNTTEQLPDLLPQLTESPAVSPINEGYEAETSYNAHTAEAYEDDILLPSASLSLPQSFDRSLPSVPLQSPKQRVQGQIEERPQRQPRLARVGRIPAVVPRNEEQSQPSRALFLKPLVRESTAENVYNLRNTPAAGFRAPLETRTHLQPGRLLPSVDRAIPSNADTLAKSEFLRFPSGAASEASTSSSSEGPLSMLGPLPGSSPPKEGHPARFAHDIDINASNSPSVDEVWNEYDDFLDHVMSPSLARKDTSSTLREKIPFPEQAERHLTASVRNAVKPQTGEPYIVFPDLSIPAMERPVFGQGTAASTASPVIFPSAMLEQTAGEDVRLRRSRIVSALHSSTDPTSPFSIRDLLNEYDSHHRSSTIPSERLSTSSASQSLKRWTATMSRPEMHKESNHQEHVALLDVVERKKDPAAQSELQFASLMVAKWLSFGRVLFSPAHDEIQTLRERHVLVIDGLGTEDWSIYCAVTYEAQQAFVHHLQEKPSGPGLKSFKASQNAPNNHRRAQVTSFDERFPFPPAFFSAVVLRFPPAMPEAKMKNIISECRRVLLPGGYLELLLLDLDIVNMGVQTRRAVRELKFRLATADTQISLRPIIDNVQSVLSARGFSSISRCVVGVPVAGRPTGSAASSSSSRSSGGSDSLPKGGAGSPRPATASPRMTFGLGRKGANLSLNDLIADHSENADAKIGRIVSRTARAWWQHCFEASVIPDGDLSRSIFAEKNLLRECRSRGSSFKMLIAHAQRPVFESRRRTMSEPLVQTLATAGAQRRTQQSSHESHTA